MINNDFYHNLGEQWYESKGDVVALLRRENAAKLPWILAQIARYHARGAHVLDAGCGGGLLTMAMSREGYHCTGLDISQGAIETARRKDAGKNCQWVAAAIEMMPFPDRSFDVVCAMDVIEHVEDPTKLLYECLRVLKPDGTLLLHTFNRTWWAWLVAERGVEWFVRDAPSHLHEWEYFVTPSEIGEILGEHGFGFCELKGIGPKVFSRAFLQLLLTRQVPENFEFALSDNLALGYLAAARLKRHA